MDFENSEGKIKIIKEILEREWQFFQSAQNTGGRAECQDNKEEFLIMRKSQWKTFPLNVLKSYLEDLKEAEKNKSNLVVEKYARMMKYSAPEEYEKIKGFFPEILPEKRETVNQIVKIYLNWEKELMEKYPKLTSKGRVLNSKDDTPEHTSIETYLKGELFSYSFETVTMYLMYIKECIQKNINLAELNIENIIKEKGYTSLEEAESKI
ncbi:DUF4125 family protein [Leptotrichia sp. OH3620_COT-345]|uniref:DUF4125 family protein n=1 Tax=Leptotrichia sp. OH3620_COT-345 TaxID=2491048 RepID=UPI000F64F3B8|nr:DUF4125 family protein [Leptotrichia sp. OH3620_COT-345]RRD39168.1 DUF4125 family protein [Leptotrichia sp. OH3620_COT-345]